jgi:phage-related protein
LSYFLKAVDRHDDKRVPENLCRFYQNTAPQDVVSAYMWCSVSAKDGSRESDKAMKELSKKLSQDQITSTSKSASEWLIAHPHDVQGCTVPE